MGNAAERKEALMPPRIEFGLLALGVIFAFAVLIWLVVS